MKAIKCKLFISTRTRIIDMGEFESKRACKKWLSELGYSVVYKII